jgi:POT family proton-dependent oligopeptide transporter
LPTPESRRAGFFSIFIEALRNMGGASLGVQLNAFGTLLCCLVLPVIMMIAMVVVALQHDITPFVKGLGWTALGCFGLLNLLVLGASLAGKVNLPDNFWNCARKRFTLDEIAAARSIVPVLGVFTFVPAFWSLFEQSNSTWVLQGAKMVPFKLLGVSIGAEQMQSLNPLLVMILIPILTWGIYPLVEKMGVKVTQLRRMVLGLALTALSYVMVGWLQHRLESGETLSLGWQAVSYVILTTGEVLISTTGLEFAYTQSASSMKSTMMSFWLLTVAIGNLLVTTITQIGGGHGDESVTAERFYQYAAITAVATVLLAIVAMRYRYREQAVVPLPMPN